MEPPTTTGTCELVWVINDVEHICHRRPDHNDDIHYCAQHFGCWPQDNGIIVPDAMGWWISES